MLNVMRSPAPMAELMVALLWFTTAPRSEGAAPIGPSPGRGVAQAELRRPLSFPHRIWAACDFEGRTPDYGWFGPAEINNLSRYDADTKKH